ncbi:hypothetical protein ACHAXA_004483 [Cyclostephanos tholiformis]|uniref:Uncharacterized protein n=1 Tax=Cyclostephanos tholiformis TaxID=382380 RepID=A0ABD3RYR4_9STRA
MQWFNCVKRFIVEQKLGYAHWILDGSYYIRDGQLNNKESYGLLEADWSKMKKNGIFAESLATIEWIGGESHRDCYRQSDMMLGWSKSGGDTKRVTQFGPAMHGFLSVTALAL